MAYNLSLHALFSDHAVLPRHESLPIYGRALPGQTVKVSFAGQQATTRAADGHWRVVLEPLPAGGPHTLTVSSMGAQLIRRNIMIGEIWLASGQSNMEWPLSEAADGATAVAAARLPRLRLFTVPRRSSLQPEPDVEARWVECSPKEAAAFSAVAFHFGRTLLDALECPIGLINASWGGTAALPWTEAGFIRGTPELAAHAVALAGVRRLVPPPVLEAKADTGNEGAANGWARLDFADAALPELPLPTMWQKHGMAFNGAVWFRRWIDLPESWARRALRLELGAIDDFDTTYFNGERIGGLGPERADAWRTRRGYTVIPALVRAGRNLIAVRVFDQMGEGGFGGPASAMRLYPDGRPEEAIPLAGLWRMIVERRIPLPPLPPRRADEAPEDEFPSGLFNGMIAPLTGFPIRGIIWYQGESDVERAHLYRTIFQRLILSWRAAWGRGDLPFLFVQLANHLDRRDEPGDDAWAELREAQTMALRLPATGMAVAADLGDAEDIHPRNKRTVGERLAIAALTLSYGHAMPHSGPVYRSHAVEGAAIRLRFEHTFGGLRARGDGLEGFEIAGADRRFRWAEAEIDGDSVLVSHPAVEAPLAVRYAWQANPPTSLENAVGLPAAPFRTDDWPGVTVGKL